MRTDVIAAWMLSLRMATWDYNGGDTIVDEWYAMLEAELQRRTSRCLWFGYYV